MMSDDVRAESTAVVAIADVSEAALADVFSARERAYAAAKSDPERRLAARLAAKQAAVAALGGGLELRGRRDRARARRPAADRAVGARPRAPAPSSAATACW